MARYALPGYLDRTRDQRRACDEKHQPWPRRAAHTRHTDGAARRRVVVSAPVLTAPLAWSRQSPPRALTFDRLVQQAHVIGLDGDSYRTRGHRRQPTK